MIQTQGLTKWYGEHLALDHLDLHLERGDLFGFIGPNGAGKTTTMKILATLLAPSEGVAMINGVNVVEDPQQVRTLVGYMPDFFGVYREMRVTEYLSFFAAAYNLSGTVRKRVVGDLLELVDLSSKSQAKVGALSRGMQQRLGLARALVHDPKVLILDEPASGLDPGARVEVREILRELSEMGKTILLSSHILPELAHVCNRVGVIAHGKLRACGTIEEVAAAVAPRSVHVCVHAKDTPEFSDEEEGQVSCEALGARALIESQFQNVSVDFGEGDKIIVTPSEKGQQIGPADVARVLVSGGFDLVFIDDASPTLEDIFLSLTSGLTLGNEEEG